MSGSGHPAAKATAPAAPPAAAARLGRSSLPPCEPQACGAPRAAELAASLASRWLASNLRGWRTAGSMHEKYDATRPGERGGGGEYVPQVGFGWTNGVALSLLARYGDRLVE